MAVFTGDTIRIKCSFYNWDGEFSDPSTVALNIYDGDGVTLVDSVTPDRSEVGVYYYDYIVPTANIDPIIYEFIGTMDGTPSLYRGVIPRKYV